MKKGEVAPRNEPSVLSKRVYLMNLPYDTYPYEVENLCKTFVPIDRVVIARDPNGLARGYAFVFVQNANDVETLIDYVDGRHIRGRQLRAKRSLGGAALKKELAENNK